MRETAGWRGVFGSHATYESLCRASLRTNKNNVLLRDCTLTLLVIPLCQMKRGAVYLYLYFEAVLFVMLRVEFFATAVYVYLKL